MSQHDFEILTSDTNTRVGFRNAVNTALQALASQSSGDSVPSTTYPCQVWADTANNLLKMRDTTNLSWITLGTLDVAYMNLVRLTQTNSFTEDQKLKGDALLLRFKDTGAGGKEWGLRSDSGCLEFCENTGTEAIPTWTARMVIDSTGITTNAQAATQADNAQTLDGNALTTTPSESAVVLTDEQGKIAAGWIPDGEPLGYNAGKWSGRQWDFGNFLFDVLTGATDEGILTGSSGYVLYRPEYEASYDSLTGKISMIYDGPNNKIKIWNDTGYQVKGKMYWAKLY